MSKSVFELLTIIEAYERYGKLAEKMQNNKHKMYYLELQKITLSIIKNLCNQKCLPSQKEMILQNPQKFYDEAYKCIKIEENCPPNLRKIVNITGKANTILKQIEKEDEWKIHQGLKLEPRAEEAILFNKIMCQKVFPFKQEMETTIGIDFFSELEKHREFSYPCTAYYWTELLKNLLEEKKITEEQYEVYLRNLEYMCNYYWDLKGNFDAKIPALLKIRYNRIMKG